MRISDWSSDVCSSDLQDPVLLLHPADAAAGRAGPDAGALLRRPQDQERCRCARHSGNQAELYLLPCRSEEHTSELQSLMRISYAVFCLKKKNDSLRRITASGDIKTT